MNGNSVTTTVSIDSILADFGFNATNAAFPSANVNLGDNDVVQFFLDELQMNDTCGVFDDLNALFNPENIFTFTEPPTPVEDDFSSGGFASFMENAFESATNAVENVMDWVENRPRVCDATGRQGFSDVMDEFGTCTGFNFRELLEDLRDQSVMDGGLQCTGELLQSIDFLQPSDSFCDGPIAPTTDDANTAAASNFRDCVDGILGPNVLGELFRLVMVTPGALCNCMSVFDRLPDCKLDPFSMPGRDMKKLACVVNTQSCPFFAESCDGRLTALNQCLPSQVELSETFVPSEETCRSIMCGCEAMDNGGMNYPARMMELPLADMCVDKATESTDLQDVPDRYEAFRSACVNADFSTPPVVEEPVVEEPVEEEVVTNVFAEPIEEEPETLTTNMASPVTTISEPVVEETNTPPVTTALETNMLSEETNESIESNKGVLTGSLIAAFLLLGLLLLAFVCIRNRRRKKQQRERFVVSKESMVSHETTPQDFEVASTKESVLTDEGSQQGEPMPSDDASFKDVEISTSK